MFWPLAVPHPALNLSSNALELSTRSAVKPRYVCVTMATSVYAQHEGRSTVQPGQKLTIIMQSRPLKKWPSALPSPSCVTVPPHTPTVCVQPSNPPCPHLSSNTTDIPTRSGTAITLRQKYTKADFFFLHYPQSWEIFFKAYSSWKQKKKEYRVFHGSGLASVAQTRIKKWRGGKYTMEMHRNKSARREE